MIVEKFIKRRLSIFFSFLSLLYFLLLDLHPDEKVSSVHGFVIDVQTRLPLANVQVKVKGTFLSAITDIEGKFVIEQVPAGEIILELSKGGFQKLILPGIKIAVDQQTQLVAELSNCEIGLEDVFFFIGGIEVIANRELLPDAIETTTQIHSGDIEHIQATSLGDVLDLVPGVEMKNQPTLKNVSKAKIRDPREENHLTSFSTKIIVDDIPFSNNVNLQGAAFKSVYTGTGDGIDLREIPADNIESIDIIRGIAPATYGDFMGGLINVKTKKYDQLLYRLKAKTNPDTKEFNFGGSIPLPSFHVNYNVNMAFCERDIRKDYDDTKRLTGQCSIINSLRDERLIFENKFKYYSLFENVKQDPLDPNRQISTGKGYRFIYGNEVSYLWNTENKLFSNLFLNYRRADSFQQFMVQGIDGIISTLTDSGTMAGIKREKPYLYQQRTLGDELSLGYTFQWSSNFVAAKLRHLLKIGNDLLYENNYGKGLSFDANFPPTQKGNRPRSFDDVPGLFQYSLYINDQIKGQLGNEFVLEVGLRYERYDAGYLKGLMLFHAQNGTFFNPRMNAAYQLSPSTQLRVGFGKSSKAPALPQIFPDDYYLDVQDIIPINEEIFIRDSIISTYKFDQSNLRLKGFQEQKYELSLDQKIGTFGLSLTGYYAERKGEPVQQIQPFVYHAYSRPNWPDLKQSYISGTFLNYYQKTTNSGRSIFSGLELTLQTEQIQQINLDLLINAAYVQVNEKKQSLLGEIIYPNNTIPFYNHHGKWAENLIFTYQLNYRSKILGLWLTLTAQHVPLNRNKTRGENDTLAVAYYDGATNQMVYINETDRLNEQYQIYHVSKNPLYYKINSFDAKWLFNLSLSKALCRGMEVSLFVNNLWDDRAIQENPASPGLYLYRNPEIFYGLEFSMQFDRLLAK